MSGQKSKNKARRCRESVNRCERARTKIDNKTEDSKSQVARSWPPHSVALSVVLILHYYVTSVPLQYCLLRGHVDVVPFTLGVDSHVVVVVVQ